MILIRNKKFTEKDTGSKWAKRGAIAGTFTPFGIAGGVAGAATGGFLGSAKDALTGEMGDEN
jgi:hypothetical protein